MRPVQVPTHVPAVRNAEARSAAWYGRSSGRLRDPALALFDPAAELVAAATALRIAADRPGTVTAVASALGCGEAALHALADAVPAMAAETARTATAGAGAATPPTAVARAQRSFARAQEALRAAEEALRAAREDAAVVLARHTAGEEGAVRRGAGRAAPRRSP